MSQDKRNVFVGISVRNKTLTKLQVQEIVTRAQRELGAHRVLFLIADELELINLRVFSRGMAATLGRQVQRRCDKLKGVIHTAISAKRWDRLYVAVDHWCSILNAEYWSTYIRVFSWFLGHEDFRADVEAVTKRFAERRGKSVTLEQTHYLSLYLLAELPTLLSGIRHQGRAYRTMIYPVRGDEAIDRIAARLAEGYYGPAQGLEQCCKVVGMPA